MSETSTFTPIYQRAFQALAHLGPIAGRIGSRDKDLASQLQRAAASVLLNLAEGMGSSRGTRRARYETSLGSARETLAVLHLARAWGYIESSDDPVIDEMDHLVAVLVRFVRKAR
jgi:four helix bundle protein